VSSLFKILIKLIKRCNYPNYLIDKEKAIHCGEWLAQNGSLIDEYGTIL
jgi:hypothetical protein